MGTALPLQLSVPHQLAICCIPGGNYPMDSLKAQYKDIIEKVLKEYADFLGSDEEVEVELVFDQQRVGAASP